MPLLDVLRPSLRLALAASALALSLAPAFAGHRHHAVAHSPIHRPFGFAGPRPPAAPAGLYAGWAGWAGWQAAVIARATAEQQTAPGLTRELAPDSLETATGGPVGGVPGFSGP